VSEEIKKSKNGQWVLEKSYSDEERKRRNRARFFASQAEEMKQQKEEDKEADRKANLSNPFTGRIDSFKPEDPKADWKSRIEDISNNPLSTKPGVDSSSMQLSPQVAFQQKKKAMAQAEANTKAVQDANHQKHMGEILAGRKQPVTMWEKAALVAHMKQKHAEMSAPKSSPQSVKSGSQPVKPSGMIVRRKEDMNKSDMSKADYEMDMSNLIELLHHIKELKANLQEGDELPDWVSAKLTLATDYLSRIAHYVDGKKEMDSPLNKIAQLEKALKDLKKEDAYWQNKKPVNQIDRENQKAVQQYRQQKMGVGQGSGPDVQVGSAPRLTGVAKEYQMGTTKSNKPIMSWPEHVAHNDFNEADHGEAFAAHKKIRDELRADRGANPKLADHHHNAAEYHSKMQAKLRSGR